MSLWPISVLLVRPFSGGSRGEPLQDASAQGFGFLGPLIIATGASQLVLSVGPIVVGFVGGMVSGFIGSGGAFVLTPAMMSLGAPAVVAVASNMAHKFPKALVGAYKRNKYGQVDIKLGVVILEWSRPLVLCNQATDWCVAVMRMKLASHAMWRWPC